MIKSTSLYNSLVHCDFTKRSFSAFFRLNGRGAWDSSVMCRSVFLDRYGSHFAAAQFGVIARSLGRLVQNTSPDITPLANTKIAEALSPIFSFSTPLFPAGVVALNPTLYSQSRSVTRDGIWRVVRGLRYGWALPNSTGLFKPFKNRATGFYRLGRRLNNTSMFLRYGASARAINWWLYIRNAASPAATQAQVTSLSVSRAGVAGGFLASTSNIPFDTKQRRFVLFTSLAGVNHLRTVWYATNSFLGSRFSQNHAIGSTVGKSFPRTPHSGFSRFDLERIRQFAGLTGNFRPNGEVSGDFLSRGVDSSTYTHFINRRHARHANYRIVVGNYERKLWNYKKTRYYWRFMRWVSHFYFKGLSYLRFFTLRVDVFLVNHLRVRNIAMSRLFVRGGHAFVGDTVCYNPAHGVERYDVVSISREVLRWMDYKSSFTAKGSRKLPGKGGIRKYISFARNSEFGGIFHGKQCAFAVLHGGYNHLVNSNEYRTSNSWSSFGYFQGQRVVASAWW